MGQSISLNKDSHIVVVGGGYSGTSLCRILQSAKANFTLIDSRDAFHHNIAAVRAIVKSGTGFAARTLIPYDATFGEHFKKGNLVAVEPENNTIKLESGESISYDVLVLATGSSAPFPSKFGHCDRGQAIEQYETYGRKLKEQTRIVIVGGGAVGVEIAGEIATEYPDKQVTIISGSDSLVMPNLNPTFYKKVDDALEKLNVKVLRGEKVTNLDDVEDGPATLYTDKSSSLEADLIIRATGVSINKEGYTAGLGDVVDAKGALKVKKTFQVEGFENIYAMGDCAGTGDSLVAFLAMEHAKFVAQNMSRQMKNQPLVEYKGHEAKFKIGLSVGRNYGFGEMKSGSMIPDFLVKKGKSSELAVPDNWKRMGQKMPK